MATISINEFQVIAGTGIEDYILLSYNGGQGGRIAVGTFKAQMAPSIKDGKTPKFRSGANGIEYAYEGEESWSLLVPYSDLKLNFDDLSEEQKVQLKMTLDDLSAEDIALLQKPATDMIAVLESTNVQMQAAKDDAQDTISDIDTIRENAEKGKDALESLDDKADKIEVIEHGTSDTTFTLTPNVFHKWGEVSNLYLTLATPSDSTIYNEYMFEFESGDTATTLSVPENIKWESDVTIESGKTYQISILNNCGVIGGF